MNLYDDDRANAESSILTAPSSSPSGIGLAPVRGEMPAAPQPREEIGVWQAMKESFKPVAVARRGRQQERESEARIKAQELTAIVTAMEHGVKMLEGLEGDQRANAAKFYGDQMERLYPGMKDTFSAIADQPALLTKFDSIMPNLPEPMRVLAKRSPKEFLKYAGTSDGQQAMRAALDSVELRTATKKVQTALMGIQQLLPPEIAEKYGQDGVITASEVFDMQQYLPENVRLTDAQAESVRRDRTFWHGLGVLSGEREQAVMEERAKKPKNKSPLGRLNAEREELVKANPDDPMIAIYDDMIKKVSQHKPAAPKAAPKPPSPVQERKDAEVDQTIEAVDARVGSMLEQLQQTPHLVGPAGAARRVTETVAGIAAPGMETPGLDYQNNLKLLLSDVRKMIEKDPNLTKEERSSLLETIGGGTFQTSGSAMRALNEVNKYVKGKRKAKPAEPSEADLKFTAEKHGITVEEVRKRLKERKR